MESNIGCLRPIESEDTCEPHKSTATTADHDEKHTSSVSEEENTFECDAESHNGVNMQSSGDFAEEDQNQLW